MSKIFVNYIVQNDQWESINEPNLYVLPGTYTNLNLITAGLIYDTFPIKHQRFYLRFFLDDKIQDLKVWMDYPPEATVPVYTDKIFVKALRLPLKADSIDYKGSEMFKRKEKDTSSKDVKNTNKNQKMEKKNDNITSNMSKNNVYDIFKSDGNVENELKYKKESVNNSNNLYDKNQKILESFEFSNIFNNNNNPNNDNDNTSKIIDKANYFADANIGDFQFHNNENTNESKFNIFDTNNNSRLDENNKANTDFDLNSDVFNLRGGKSNNTTSTNIHQESKLEDKKNGKSFLMKR